MQEDKVKDDLSFAETEEGKDDPPTGLEGLSVIVTLINGRLDTQDSNIKSIKESCEGKIAELDKKISKHFRISIGLIILVLAAYCSLPPETLKSLIEIIINIFGK